MNFEVSVEQPVVNLGRPFPFEPVSSNEFGFATHTGPFAHGQRRFVAGINHRRDAVRPKRIENETEHRTHRLGGVAVTGVCGVEDVADLDGGIRHRMQNEQQIPDQPPAVGELDSQLDQVAVRTEDPTGNLAFEVGRHRVGVTWVERDVAHRLGMRMKFQQLVEVFRHEGAQHETVGTERQYGSEWQR
jgi:hypothetical protein